jgi:hypothetical protein
MNATPTACPGCRLSDHARSVNAVLLDGHTSTHSVGTYGGMVGFAPAGGVVTQHGRAVTGTAQLLMPPPLPPPRTGWYGWIAVLTAYCLFWPFVGVIAWSGPPQARPSLQVAITGPAILAAPGLIALALVIAGLVRIKRKDRLRRNVAPWVAMIHQQAWYCGRCAGAFFRAGTVPKSIPTGTLIPIGAFRDTIWLLGHQQWTSRRQSLKEAGPQTPMLESGAGS